MFGDALKNRTNSLLTVGETTLGRYQSTNTQSFTLECIRFDDCKWTITGTMYINGQVQDMTKGLQSTHVAMGQSTLGAPHSYVARMQYVNPPPSE